jgi:hypothetical protein
MRHLIRSLSALVLLLAVAACDPITVETTTLDVLPPPDLPGAPSSSMTTTTESPPVTDDPSPYTYWGYLPNGAHFMASVPGPRAEPMTLIQGVFFFHSDGAQTPVGEVRYTRVAEPPDTNYDSGILQLGNSEWLVEVLFDTAVLEALGGVDSAEAVAMKTIELDVEQGWPVVRLSGPFTWGNTGATLPSVRFESFMIGAGCSGVMVACADTRAVHLSSLSDVIAGAAGMSQEQRLHTWLETSTPRHVLDPNYLNPGPLDPRLSADLIWTGEEMIIWGGKQARDGLTTLVDGAAFNPDTDEWRPIAPFPLQGPQATRAVWGDGEMIVVSHNGTFGYDPESDSWRTIANGVVPSEWHDRMVYSDGKLYMWVGAQQIHELTINTGQWRILEPPGPISASRDSYFSVLRIFDDGVIAITLDGGVCWGRHFWQLDGNAWDPLPDFSLETDSYADCATANQSASVGNSLVIWEAESHPSAIYSASTNEWRDLSPIPLGGTEGASGPVPMGGDHFLVPRWGEAAIFDATTEEWTRVLLPGQGTDAEMIWTGEEILAWGIWETFDAWRWTPGQTVIGGDDAS